MIDASQLNVGDVLAVHCTGLFPKLISLAEVLHGIPSDANHTAVVHHKSAGIWWGLEGRPGGVGWVDMRGYLNSRWTVANTAQPKTPDQRATVADVMEQMLGDKYDWVGIGVDAVSDLGLPNLFVQDWNGQGVPGHVVCSSVAAYVYGRVGLARPHGDRGGRFVQPGDWGQWIDQEGWLP